MGVMNRGINGICSFAPLRPADFINFEGGAGQGLIFVGRGGGGWRGGSIPDVKKQVLKFRLA